jgi:hypothetical protein
MIREALGVRGGGPVMMTNCKSVQGIEPLIDRLTHDVSENRSSFC